MVWRYSKRADKILIHNVNNKLMVELNQCCTIGIRFSLPNATPRMCRSSNSVETDNFNPFTLMNAGSNDNEVELGLAWGHWSVRKHGMMLSIDSLLRKLVLTNDGFVLSDLFGGLVVNDSVEQVLSSLECEKHIAQAESAARVAYARNNSPKVGFNPAPYCQLNPLSMMLSPHSLACTQHLAPSNNSQCERQKSPLTSGRGRAGAGAESGGSGGRA